MYSYNELREVLLHKSRILIEGIEIDESIKNQNNFNPRKNHLYLHSKEEKKFIIPDDTILLDSEETTENSIVVRNRINSNSFYKLKVIDNEPYLLYKNQKIKRISFPPKLDLDNQKIIDSDYNYSSVVTKLGTDLCGVILSNYCFYFKNNEQCKFCEIIPNFKNQKYINVATKPDQLVINAFKNAIEKESSYNHMVMTTGNIVSYDETFKRFINILNSLKDTIEKFNVTFTATLMPPKDLKLIDELKEAGCTNVYFDLEMFNHDSFSWMVPGKDKYGYKNMINALEYAVKIFGPGHVFSNFVYGIQSIKNKNFDFNINMEEENKICLEGVKKLLEKKIIPTFTIYHHSGQNEIGDIKLNPEDMFNFFCQYGDLIYNANIIDKNLNSIIFSVGSTSNTLYNDFYFLSKLKHGGY